MIYSMFKLGNDILVRIIMNKLSKILDLETVHHKDCDVFINKGR